MAKPRIPLDPAMHRIRLDKLRIFEITEAELEALERDSPESLFLNLAITVLSIAISFSVAIAITKIDSDRAYYVFVIVTSVGYVVGITFGLLWFMSRPFTQECIRGHPVANSTRRDPRRRCSQRMTGPFANSERNR